MVEWVFFWLFESLLHVQYLVATVLAIVISTFSNWLFGRLWTFKDSKKGNVLAEIGKIYVASIVGLLLNLLIMWALVDGAGLIEMLSKITPLESCLSTTIWCAFGSLIGKSNDSTWRWPV